MSRASALRGLLRRLKRLEDWSMVRSEDVEEVLPQAVAEGKVAGSAVDFIIATHCGADASKRTLQATLAGILMLVTTFTE
jgi:hypothetical protein